VKSFQFIVVVEVDQDADLDTVMNSIQDYLDASFKGDAMVRRINVWLDESEANYE
jgi:hypothetical protein